MAFLGLRGLIGQALREGDQAKALAYAERAFKLKPQTPWVVHSLFDMQAQIGQWKAAQETLETGQRRKVVTADKGRTLKAMLLVERSRAAERDGNAADALALAREAFALAPERIAVTQRFAELQIKAGDGRRAQEDAGARLGAGAASRSRHALPRSVGRERSAEAHRRRAPAGVTQRERHREPSGAGPGLARGGSVGRGAAASRNRRRHQPAGARLPPDGRGRGACGRRARPRCTIGWPAPPTRRPTAPGAAPPAPPSTRPGARCARAAAPSAPCNGARPGTFGHVLPPETRAELEFADKPAQVPLPR